MKQTLEEFKQEVSTILGIESNSISDKQWNWHHQWENPKWAAVCILRDISGLSKQAAERVKALSHKLGFS